VLGFVAFALTAHDTMRAAAAVAPEVIPIAEARALPSGSEVVLEGSVSVPSGAFKSGTSDEGFVMQDRSGGIYVRTAANLGLRVRQQVRVVGQLADSNGLLILVPAGARGVRVRGRGMKIAAQPVSTGRINEATEGRLVRVAGTITKPVANDLPYGYRLFIDDGSGELQAFVYTSTGIDLSGLQPGQRIGVTGFSGQYNDHYEIIPRFQSDISPRR
jgi:DNA/RNA endonuclease YhcR with UshA esterase domain